MSIDILSLYLFNLDDISIAQLQSTNKRLRQAIFFVQESDFYWYTRLCNLFFCTLSQKRDTWRQMYHNLTFYSKDSLQDAAVNGYVEITEMLIKDQPFDARNVITKVLEVIKTVSSPLRLQDYSNIFILFLQFLPLVDANLELNLLSFCSIKDVTLDLVTNLVNVKKVKIGSLYELHTIIKVEWGSNREFAEYLLYHPTSTKNTFLFVLLVLGIEGCNTNLLTRVLLDLRAKKIDPTTLLSTAMANYLLNKNDKMVEFLLDWSDTNLHLENAENVMMECLIYNSLDLYRLLSKDVRFSSSHLYEDILSMATEMDNIDFALEILNSPHLKHIDKNLLLTSIENNSLQIVKALVAKGIKFNTDAIFSTIERDFDNILSFILKKGISPNFQTKDYTLLEMAISSKSKRCIQLLLSQDLQILSNDRSIFLAITKGNIPLAECLLNDKRFEPSLSNGDILVRAVGVAPLTLIKKLLSHQQLDKDNIALKLMEIASRRRDVQILTFLITNPVIAKNLKTKEKILYKNIIKNLQNELR